MERRDGLPSMVGRSAPRRPSPQHSRRHQRTILKLAETRRMTLTPALALLGIVLVLVAIPFAFSLAPLIVGAIVLIWAARRGHRELSIATPAAAAA
jgi:hypothetical protein